MIFESDRMHDAIAVEKCKRSKEVRDKISKGMKRFVKNNPNRNYFQKGFTPWNKDKTAKEDARIPSGTNHSHWKNGNRTKICPNCGKKFQVYYYRKDIAIYCSGTCRSKALTGKYTGKDNPNWKGGRFVDNNGYVLVYHPGHPFVKTNGYVFEHRIVIEKHLGRYLLPEEKCHHLGAKDDNRLMMLMAFSSNSAHRRFHNNPKNVKTSEIIFDGRQQRKRGRK